MSPLNYKNGPAKVAASSSASPQSTPNSAVLVVAFDVLDVARAFTRALGDPKVDQYFSVVLAVGTRLGIVNLDDAEETKRVTQRIFEPFLDL